MQLDIKIQDIFPLILTITIVCICMMTITLWVHKMMRKLKNTFFILDNQSIYFLLSFIYI